MIDKVDELIISTLSKNSKQDTFEIWDFVRGYGYRISEEEIDARKHVLEKKNY